MFPEVELAEKANGREKSFQGRGSPEAWDMIPGDMMFVQLGQVADELTPWSIWPTRRDAQLRKFYRSSDGALASAVNTMQSKLKSLPYKVSSPGPRAQKRFSDMLGTCEFGAGLPALLGKTAVDNYTQDNGWFIELIGAGRADRPLRGPVLSMAHLDSGLCWRTFDPEFPVLYTNPYAGTYHKIHESRVVFGSSFTQSEELARGIGYCAVSRALRAAQIARDIAVYRHEKVSGRFKRAIGWGSGFTNKSFRQAMGEFDEEEDVKGYTRFSDIPFVFTARDQASLNLLDLASLPDGFNAETDTTMWIYLLAFAFGVDAREFWPGTASGATKADATVQHMKSGTKGFAEDVKGIEQLINWKVFPEGTILTFDAKDDAEDQRVATLHGTYIDNAERMARNGFITVEDGRNILVAKGVIEPRVIVHPETAVEATDSSPMDPNATEPLPPLPETPAATGALGSPPVPVPFSTSQTGKVVAGAGPNG